MENSLDPITKMNIENRKQNKDIAAELTKVWFNFAAVSKTVNPDEDYRGNPDSVYEVYSNYLKKLNNEN